MHRPLESEVAGIFEAWWSS